MKKAVKLGSVLALPALDGHIASLAAVGKLTVLFAIPLGAFIIAGPTAWMLAAQLPGSVVERVFAAFLAGCVATLTIMIAAVLGSLLTQFLDMRIMQVTAALLLVSIAAMLIELKIPATVPVLIVIIGTVASLVVKN